MNTLKAIQTLRAVAIGGLLAVLIGGCLVEETGEVVDGADVGSVDHELAETPEETGTPRIVVIDVLGGELMEPDPEPWCPPAEEGEDPCGDDVVLDVPSYRPGTPGGQDGSDGESGGSKD